MLSSGVVVWGGSTGPGLGLERGARGYLAARYRGKNDFTLISNHPH